MTFQYRNGYTQDSPLSKMSPENQADIAVYAATLVAHSSILIHIMFLEKKKRVQTL